MKEGENVTLKMWVEVGHGHGVGWAWMNISFQVYYKRDAEY